MTTKPTPTLATAFASLRDRSGLTLVRIGELCDLNHTTVFKVEAGRPVRWETLHLILTLGFSIRIGTKPYKEFHDLWLADAAQRARYHSKAKGPDSLSPSAAAAVKAFREIVRTLDDGRIHRVMHAARRAATSR